MKKYINIVFFVGLIFTVFSIHICKVGQSTVNNWENATITMSNKLENIKSACEEVTEFEQEWINVYGLSQRMLGKNTIEDFTIYKDQNGKMQRTQAFLAEEEVADIVENLNNFYVWLGKKEIPMYYVAMVLPVESADDVLQGIEDYSFVNAQRLEEELTVAGIPIINLRDSEKIAKIGREERFYKTDHHWTMQTNFTAFRDIVERVEEDLGWNLRSENFMDLGNYEIFEKEDCFLGSFGIKVGKYYAGKDDFVIYLPKTDTAYTFEKYDSNQNLMQTKEGSFKEALIDWSIITDDSYNNKYNAFSNQGSVENRFINHSAFNDKKVLLISHSYGRPLSMYLSLCFGQLRNIDLQDGRFTGDVVAYVEEYDPDLVIVMTECEGVIAGRPAMEKR